MAGIECHGFDCLCAQWRNLKIKVHLKTQKDDAYWVAPISMPVNFNDIVISNTIAGMTINLSHENCVFIAVDEILPYIYCWLWYDTPNNLVQSDSRLIVSYFRLAVEVTWFWCRNVSFTDFYRLKVQWSYTVSYSLQKLDENIIKTG